MYSLIEKLGGTIRWILRGCKTKLKDEIDGKEMTLTGFGANHENYTLGIFLCLLIVVLARIVFF